MSSHVKSCQVNSSQVKPSQAKPNQKSVLFLFSFVKDVGEMKRRWKKPKFFSFFPSFLRHIFSNKSDDFIWHSSLLVTFATFDSFLFVFCFFYLIVVTLVCLFVCLGRCRWSDKWLRGCKTSNWEPRMLWSMMYFQLFTIR